MSFTQVLSILKAWPTREERLRKGLMVAKPDDAEPIPDNRTAAQRRAATRLLKLRANQRKRRRASENKQRERSDVPEAKL